MLKEEQGMPYSRLCPLVPVAYSSCGRWRSRVAQGRPPVQVPGPKKQGFVAPAVLEEELTRLKHNGQRSRGVGALYLRHRDALSRRDLATLVLAAREQAKRERRAALAELTWLVPGLVWAMDDSFLNGRSGPHLHLVQDLGSRYKLPPLVSQRLATGEQVAAHLERQFADRPPPLFCKRDNGSNLNHWAVDQVLAAARVLPLNSPPYYAPYNGGIEYAQREVKAALLADCCTPRWLPPPLQTEAELVVTELNHKPRPCLEGHTSTERFAQGQQAARRYQAAARREVEEQLTERAARIAAHLDGPDAKAQALAWRLAVEHWLVTHNIITITTHHQVLPDKRRLVDS
jgi:hypothetical protein